MPSRWAAPPLLWEGHQHERGGGLQTDATLASPGDAATFGELANGLPDDIPPEGLAAKPRDQLLLFDC